MEEANISTASHWTKRGSSKWQLFASYNYKYRPTSKQETDHNSMFSYATVLPVSSITPVYPQHALGYILQVQRDKDKNAPSRSSQLCAFSLLGPKASSMTRPAASSKSSSRAIWRCNPSRKSTPLWSTCRWTRGVESGKKGGNQVLDGCSSSVRMEPHASVMVIV
jgi:hypothetical protein